MIARATTKRPYLSSAQRRQEFLAAAGEIVEKRGWSALTMKGLAETTGVSRQLVYGHFSDNSDLLVSVLRHLFERAREATVAIQRRAHDDAGGAIRAAYQVYLDLPRAQRRALRALSGEGGLHQPEMNRARALMRDEVLALWVPLLRQRTRCSLPQARALVWMLISAAWGLADLVEEGSLSANVASDMLVGTVEGILLSSTKLSATLGRASRDRKRTARGEPSQ